MSERWWSVDVDADVGSAPDEILEELLTVLPDAGASSPALSWGDGELSVRFSLLGPDPGEAVTFGLLLFRAAAEKLGIEVREIFRAEAVTHDRLDQELEAEPERYVGVSEIAAMLGVSKQRVSELRTRADFPAPIAELAAGPVWREANLRRFIAEWPRRPGRPQSWANLAEELEELVGRRRGAVEELLSEMDRQAIEYLTALRNASEHPSMHDLAEMLGVSEEAARSRIRRARSKLEDLIGSPVDEVEGEEEPAPAGAQHERS